MAFQKIQGCLELRLSPFLLFLCPPDACNFYYLISSFWDQILISSLNLGRARLSLHHLFGWSTAVRDLPCEGNLEALSALSLITNENAWGEKKMTCAGRIPSPCPFACAPVRCVLLSGSGRSPVRSMSIPPDCLWHRFEGNPTLCKTKSFKHCSCVAASLRERICSRVCEQHSQSVLGDTLTRVSLYSSEHQQPGLFGLALGVLGGLRAAGVLGGCGSEGRCVGGSVVPTRRGVLSPEAVCNSKTNSSICCGFPAGAALTLFHGVSEIP